MKKYLTAATLLAAGTAFANAATIVFDDPTTAATMVLTINVDAFKDINGAYFGGASDVTTIASFSGTWYDGNVGYLGVCNNGSSSGHTTTLYTSWQKGSDSATNTTLNMQTIFNSSTDWDSISKISVVYAFDATLSTSAATVATAALSILWDDDSITTYSGTAENIVFSGQTGFTATDLTTNDALVLTAEVINGAVSVAQAEALSIAAIPEPSAFGLLAGVGALALVASRRRRAK